MNKIKLVLCAVIIFFISVINVSFFQNLGIIPRYNSGYLHPSAWKIILVIRVVMISLVVVVIFYEKILKFIKKINTKIIILVPSSRKRTMLVFLLGMVLLFIFYWQANVILKMTIIELKDRHEDIPKNRYLIEFLKVITLQTIDSVELYPRLMYALITIPTIDDKKIDLTNYYLSVKLNNLDILNKNLPESGKEYVSGYLTVDNKTFPTKLRYRGLEIENWFFPKKSYKLKLKDDLLFNGQNKLNLLATEDPSMIELKFMYDFANKENIMSAKTNYATLFLNSKYHGVYLDVSQLDETFLRKEGYLPGDIFGIDMSNENIKNNITGLNMNESIYWEIEANYDNDLERIKNNIEYFLINLNLSNQEFKNYYERHLGSDYLRYNSYLIFFGDTHTSDNGNLRIYYNPATEKYVHILWDPIIVGGSIPVDSAMLTPMKNSYLFPELVEEKNKYLYEFLLDYVGENNSIDEYAEKIKYEMFHDKYKIKKTTPWFITNSEWENAVREIKKRIENRVNYVNQSLQINNVTIFVLNETVYFDVDGVSGSTIYYVNNSCNTYILRAKEEKFCGEKKIGTFLPGRKNGLFSVKGFDNIIVFEPSALRYNLTWEDKIPNSFLVVNSITGKRKFVNIKRINSANELPILNRTISFHPWNNEVIENETIVINGTWIINKDTHIKQNQHLNIRPGTKVLINSNVSLNIEGSIIAKGTVDNPIIFTNYNNTWGAITISGKNAFGIFDYTIIENGSGDIFGRSKYTGMLSIYGARSIVINNSIIRNNRYFDDAFNSKETYTIIENNIIENTYSDAIDFDKSAGKIKNNRFYNIGGDAIDISTTNIDIIGNYIELTGDKGISVGEKSNPTIIGNRIKNTSIGIAVKDLSSPSIKNNSFFNNDYAIAVYKKIWRYEYGGVPTIGKNKFYNNRMNISIDDPIFSIGNNSIVIYINESG
jgi:parallel beta-helix repeat protein